MKLLVILNHINDFANYEHSPVDGFIIGLKGYNHFYSGMIALDELKKNLSKMKASGKEVFISMNKIIHNEELHPLKETLIGLSLMDIDGIIFDDLAILQISKDLGLPMNLVYGSTHLLTNHFTADYYFEKGVPFGMLSTEISLEDCLKIKAKTKMKLMMTLYGFLDMTHSSRTLVRHYFEYIKEPQKNNEYYIHEPVRKEDYPILEDEHGTYIFHSKILNGACVIPQIMAAGMDYIVLNGSRIEPTIFKQVVDCFIQIRENSQDPLIVQKHHEMINDLSGTTDYGFLFKETVYKVKNNEE